MIWMSEKIRCSVLRDTEVEVRGEAISFLFGSEKETYYLSEEAMTKLIGELSKSLYNKMASQIVHLERVKDAVIEERDKLLSRIDYEMNDHRQQVEEGKADWAVEENL